MSDMSKFFNRPGFISLREYISDIDTFKKNSPWRLPMRLRERVQLAFLRMIVKFSWFADALFMAHGSNVGPAYAILLNYAQKKGLFEVMSERNLHCQGYFSYYLIKRATIHGRESLMTGQGIAVERDIALSKALGEMLERVISGLYDKASNVCIAAPNKLLGKRPIIYPPQYHRFLKIQTETFERLRHNPEKPISWVKGKNLVTGEATLIPRQMTSWFIANRQKRNMFIHSTTNGAAGYFTREGAALRGLLEVVQRDGFLVHWLTTIPPQLIRSETLPVDIQKKIQELESYGMSIHILNVTALPIPSVFIAVLNSYSEEDPQVVLSGSSALTFAEAIELALREMMIAAEMLYYPKPEVDELAPEPVPFISRLGKIERQLYWRGAEKVEKFKWFITGEKVSYDDLIRHDISGGKNDRERLAICLDRLKSQGPEFYPVVYFPKNEVQEELGFYVAQVFIPKAFPFYLVEYLGTFDSDRLDQFARSRGISNWKLNPLPHMFS
ncbi:MAG: YcaO-like family protein [Undibacterium sp.]